MKRQSRSRQGMSLLAMLIVVLLVAGITGALLLSVVTDHRSTDLARNKTRATYLAEAAVEQAAHLIRTGYANEILPPPPSVPTGQVTIAGKRIGYSWSTGSGLKTFTLSSDSTAPLSQQLTVNGKAIEFVAQQYRIVPPPNIQGQLSTTKVLFEIKVTTRQHDALGYVIRDVEAQVIPLFQFLAFYNGDLEFLPGPGWVGRGRMHTNSDLYLAAGTSLDLETDYVQAVGNMYRHRKDNPAGSATGPVRVQDGSGALVDWAMTLESGNQFGSDSSVWASESLDKWDGNVKSGSTGAMAVESPKLGSILPPTSYDSKGGLFYQKAESTGLIIKADAAGSVKALFQGADVTTALTTAGVITGGRTLYDARQNQTTRVPTTEIDVGKLKDTAFYPNGGVLYVHDERNPLPPSEGAPVTPPATPAGFVFKNASELPQVNGGITIASNGPVYMHGDFNAKPTDPAYVKQPAAVIADAVNLLSNSWNSTKAAATGIPVAGETTYNFAMVTGNVPTPSVGGGNYSGGLENLPRFHENWAGIRCIYTGAMINLWQSQLATGRWGQANVYSPPRRIWNFDQDYVDPNKPKPPAFPFGVSIGRTTYEEKYR